MTAPLLAGFLLTALVGVSLGMLGAGGSIIMLPLLVYIIGVEPHAAVPLSLAVVGTTSALSVVARSSEGEIQWRPALLFGGAALAGAAVGSRLTSLVPAPLLLLSFGLLLVIVGTRMWRRPDGEEGAPPRAARPGLMGSAGAGVGVLTGFLGVGGGFLIVPALMKVGGLDIKQAVSSSLAVIAMSSAAGLAGHLSQGAAVPAGLALGLTTAAVAGMAAGTAGARRVSRRQLRRGFAGFVASVGAALVVVNAPAAMQLLG